MNRGYTWNLLAAYATTGYLPCYVTKEGYFNTETFLQWLEKELLPHCNAYPGINSVIVPDNASAHCDQRIANAIRAKDYLVRFLPLYSPEYSPIELTFNILKAWVRRRFQDLWPSFEGSFDNFLLMCVRRSRCDRFTETYFRHSGAGGYIFRGDIKKFERGLRVFERDSGEGEIEI